MIEAVYKYSHIYPLGKDNEKTGIIHIETNFTGILDGNQHLVAQQVTEALNAGLAPELILKDGLVSAMSEVGRLFENGEYYVPEMLIAARAMQSGLKLLKPGLVDSGIKAAGRVVIGTVAGDLHDIGKNLVGMMLEGAGFEVQSSPPGCIVVNLNPPCLFLPLRCFSLLQFFTPSGIFYSNNPRKNMLPWGGR